MLFQKPSRCDSAFGRGRKLILRSLILAAALALLPVAAPAQDQTLADIRQELSVLFVDIQRLKRELSTTGGAGLSTAGETPLQRMDAIERELKRLTAKTEELEFRVNSIVNDGTNRIGDLEFRLCELEANCNIASLGDTPRLGGGTAPATGTDAGLDLREDTGELALSEQADFDRAKAALDAGEFANAMTGFQAFVETYPGGPLTSAAHLHRGEALDGMGETSSAARAYLESFSGDPNSASAPMALLKLGVALGSLGQTSEACVTLGEVSARFPGGPAAGQAVAARTELGCS